MSHFLSEGQKAHRQTPEYKARKKAYNQAHRQTPEYKAWRKAYNQAHRQTPEYKAWRKAYNQTHSQTPEYKAWRKAYDQAHRQTPEYKAWRKAYRETCSQTPEHKARRKAYLKKYFAKPEVKRLYRGSHYSLTSAVLRALFFLQNGACAICERAFGQFETAKYNIDHDHACCSGGKSCGKCVRGLLCPPCNTRLVALDTPGWLEKGLRYKARPPAIALRAAGLGGSGVRGDTVDVGDRQQSSMGDPEEVHVTHSPAAGRGVLNEGAGERLDGGGAPAGVELAPLDGDQDVAAAAAAAVAAGDLIGDADAHVTLAA